MATNFATKLTITRHPWKIIASCFHITPYFRARAIRWCHLNFSSDEFWDKSDYNSAPVKDNCALFSPTFLFLGPGYAMVACKFLPWRPLLSWQPTVFIQRQNRLQAHKSVKRWNAAARLYGVTVGQIPRSTERISSYFSFYWHTERVGFHLQYHTLYKLFTYILNFELVQFACLVKQEKYAKCLHNMCLSALMLEFLIISTKRSWH